MFDDADYFVDEVVEWHCRWAVSLAGQQIGGDCRRFELDELDTITTEACRALVEVAAGQVVGIGTRYSD